MLSGLLVLQAAREHEIHDELDISSDREAEKRSTDVDPPDRPALQRVRRSAVQRVPENNRPTDVHVVDFPPANGAMKFLLR